MKIDSVACMANPTDNTRRAALKAISGAYSHIVDHPAPRRDGDYLCAADFDAVQLLNAARERVENTAAK